MTNNKPLGEWTPDEVKAECDGRDGCLGCPFSKTFRSDELENGCGIQEPPFSWDLTEPPRFTPDEEAALRVLKAAGYIRIFRDVRQSILWLYDDLSNTAGSLPQNIFPSIKPGQEVKL